MDAQVRDGVAREAGEGEEKGRRGRKGVDEKGSKKERQEARGRKKFNFFPLSCFATPPPTHPILPELL